MTRQDEWESGVQWLGMCQTCSNLTWLNNSEISELDQCEACFQ